MHGSHVYSDFDLKTGERIQRYPPIMIRDVRSVNSLVTSAFIRSSESFHIYDEGHFSTNSVSFEPYRGSQGSRFGLRTCI